MGKKEEITDLLSDEAFGATYTDSGDYVFVKGKVLKFNYEGSITSIKITKIDRKNKRAWGEHIELIPQDLVRSHVGHLVDNTKETVEAKGYAYCEDCEVTINQSANEIGMIRARGRKNRTLSDGTEIEEDEDE